MRPEREREFADFVVARMPALLRYAHLLTGERARAEDLVQEAFAHAYRRWGRLEIVGADAYLRTMILRAHLSRWRRLLSRGEPTAAPPEPLVVADEADEVAARAALWQALATLPPRQRAVLVLRHYEDLTETEIADSLGTATGTVHSLGAKALTGLREALALPGEASIHTGERS